MIGLDLKIKLLKNQGTVVPGENLRGGRRAIKLDGITPLKCKTTSRDRKDTLNACVNL